MTHRSFSTQLPGQLLEDLAERKCLLVALDPPRVGVYRQVCLLSRAVDPHVTMAREHVVHPQSLIE